MVAISANKKVNVTIFILKEKERTVKIKLTRHALAHF